MCGEQGFLKGVRSVLDGVTGATRDVPQVVVMPVQKRCEGMTITGDMGRQQIDVRGHPLALGDPPEDSHRRMLTHFVALNSMSAMDD